MCGSTLLASAPFEGNSAAIHIYFYLMLWLVLSNDQGNMIQLLFSDFWVGSVYKETHVPV